MEDVVVCKIKDNPTPVEFPISIIGAKPVVHVRLDDGTPGPAQVSATAPPASTELKPKTPPAKGAKADAGPPNKILTEGVVFDRLLVNKKDVKCELIAEIAVTAGATQCCPWRRGLAPQAVLCCAAMPWLMHWPG